MKAPHFWAHSNLKSRLLAPLGALYGGLGRLRRAFKKTIKVPIPVICVGNVVVGGSGKTPMVHMLANHLKENGLNVHILCYGYGGDQEKSQRVNLGGQMLNQVGDEAILHAKVAPTWAGEDRATSARMAVSEGAQVIIMDDGFQYPGLYKDVNILIFDGGYGIGNGQMMPAGPLRESLKSGLARADAAVIVGEDRVGIGEKLTSLPTFHAEVMPEEKTLKGKRVVAFAGIGRPQKFFNTIRRLGADVIATHAFPDHHYYTRAELRSIFEGARLREAEVYTTTKDAVKLPTDFKRDARVLNISLSFKDSDALEKILAPILSPNG